MVLKEEGEKITRKWACGFCGSVKNGCTAKLLSHFMICLIYMLSIITPVLTALAMCQKEKPNQACWQKFLVVQFFLLWTLFPRSLFLQEFTCAILFLCKVDHLDWSLLPFSDRSPHKHLDFQAHSVPVRITPWLSFGRQDFRPEPVQAGRAEAPSEASEKREEESDGSEPLGRRHQTAPEHHQRLRHPRPEASH